MSQLNLNGAEGSEDSSNRVLDNSLVGENTQGYTRPQSPNTNTPNPMPISNTPFFTPETKKFVHFHDQIHIEIENETTGVYLSIIHIWRYRRIERCKPRGLPYHKKKKIDEKTYSKYKVNKRHTNNKQIKQTKHTKE